MHAMELDLRRYMFSARNITSVRHEIMVSGLTFSFYNTGLDRISFCVIMAYRPIGVISTTFLI